MLPPRTFIVSEDFIAKFFVAITVLRILYDSFHLNWALPPRLGYIFSPISICCFAINQYLSLLYMPIFGDRNSILGIEHVFVCIPNSLHKSHFNFTKFIPHVVL